MFTSLILLQVKSGKLPFEKNQKFYIFMVLCWFDVITVIKGIHYAPLMFHTRAPVLNIDGSMPEVDVYTVY